MNPLPATADLLQVARRVVWFKAPEEELADPVHFLAHVMTFGTPEDLKALQGIVSQAGVHLAIDMSAVDFIDSGGLGMLLWAKKQLQATGGKLRLFGLTERVKDVFDITRLEKALDVRASEEQALAGL